MLHAERFSQALAATITDPELRELSLTGTVDQFADNTDLLVGRVASRAVTTALAGSAPTA